MPSHADGLPVRWSVLVRSANCMIECDLHASRAGPSGAWHNLLAALQAWLTQHTCPAPPAGLVVGTRAACRARARWVPATKGGHSRMSTAQRAPADAGHEPADAPETSPAPACSVSCCNTSIDVTAYSFSPTTCGGERDRFPGRMTERPSVRAARSPARAACRPPSHPACAAR